MTTKKPLERITIDTGVKHVAIENQHGKITGEISFNPEDAAFRSKFFSVRKEISVKMEEFNSEAEKFDKEAKVILADAKKYLLSIVDDVDEDVDVDADISENSDLLPPDILEANFAHAEKENKLFIDYCDYMGDLVDGLFGESTAENVACGVKNPAIYMQFLEGVAPFLSVESEKNVAKYTPRKRSKKRKRSR